MKERVEEHRAVGSEPGFSGDEPTAQSRRATSKRYGASEKRELFKQGYRGSRFSFGCPACPNMEDQAILLELLGAKKIGIEMSEEFQLVPEQSTSALVCHHPAAKYFTI